MNNDLTRTRAFKSIVRNPALYRILQPMVSLFTIREENPAFKIWVRFLINITARAYARSGPVIWMNAFAPAELAYAMDGVPFMPEIIAAIVAYLNQSQLFIDIGNESISTDLCSFYRCALGLIKEGYLPEPDLIISSSQLCDGANKFFSYLSKIYMCPHILIDIPYSDGSGAREYLKDQLQELIERSSHILRRPFNNNRLSNTLYLSGRARAYLEKANNLRKHIPTPICASEGCSYIAGMNFYSPGSEWGEQFFKALCRFLEQKVKSKKGYLEGEKYRLLWLHHIRPFYRNDIFEILSLKKAAIPFEEANYLYWPPPDPDRPIDSIVDKMLSNVWAGPLERRIMAVEEMIRQYRIDGVIHFSHWGCRHSCGGAAVLGDWLKSRGIPFIVLHGDGADPSNYSPGQSRTRLEAFVEMLER